MCCLNINHMYRAGLNALAGPLHGLANQEVLSWIQQLQAKFAKEGKEVNKTTIAGLTELSIDNAFILLK